MDDPQGRLLPARPNAFSLPQVSPAPQTATNELSYKIVTSDKMIQDTGFVSIPSDAAARLQMLSEAIKNTD